MLVAPADLPGLGDFFDPTPEQQNVVLIDAATLQMAQRMIAGCEACSEDAELLSTTSSTV
jgi:hypothetical protein